MSIKFNDTIEARFSSSADGYALIDDRQISGSFVSFSSLTEMIAHPAYLRKPGMFAGVPSPTSSGSLYFLQSDLTTWTPYSGALGPTGATPALSTNTPVSIGTVASAGSSLSASKDDHIHTLPANISVTQLTASFTSFTQLTASSGIVTRLTASSLAVGSYDISTIGAADGHVMRFNGSQFVPATLTASISPVIIWDSSRTWTQVYSDITNLNFKATVHVYNDEVKADRTALPTPRIVTAGSYNLLNVNFVGIFNGAQELVYANNGKSYITFESGTFINSGSYCNLNIENIYLALSSSFCLSGSVVSVCLYNSELQRLSDFKVVPQSFYTFVNLSRESKLSNSTTSVTPVTPMFEIASDINSSYGELRATGNSRADRKVYGGASDTVWSALISPDSQNAFNRQTIFTLASYVPATQYNDISLKSYTSAQLTSSADAGNIGVLRYDSSNARPVFSNGSSWSPMVTIFATASIDIGSSNSAGAAASASRADHTHALPTSVTISQLTASSAQFDLIQTTSTKNFQVNRTDGTKIFDIVETNGLSTFYNNLHVQDSIFLTQNTGRLDTEAAGTLRVGTTTATQNIIGNSAAPLMLSGSEINLSSGSANLQILYTVGTLIIFKPNTGNNLSFRSPGQLSAFEILDSQISISAGNGNGMYFQQPGFMTTDNANKLGYATNRWSEVHGLKFLSSGSIDVGTTKLPGLILTTTSASQVNAQQYSPLLELAGQGFATTPSRSDVVRWGLQARPVQAADNPSGELVVWHSTGSDAYTEKHVFTTSSLKLSGIEINPVGAAGGQILRHNGTAFVPATLTGSTSVYFSNADYAKNLNRVGTAGNYSTGAVFQVSTPITMTGVRWWQPATYTTPVTASLWVNGVAVATKLVTPTAGAVNTASFDTPYALSPTANSISIALHDGGVHQILYSAVAAPGGNPAGVGGTIWGPGIWLIGIGYVAGNNALGSTFTTSYNGIEPIYTIP